MWQLTFLDLFTYQAGYFSFQRGILQCVERDVNTYFTGKSPILDGSAKLSTEGDIHLSRPWAIEFAEENPLPGAELQPTVRYGDRNAGAKESDLDV